MHTCRVTTHLAGGAVGQAGLVVGSKVEIGGAGAPMTPPW